jgi:hypothetical protein
MKFPAKLGECIDLAYTLQQQYLVKKAEADAVASKVKEVEDHIIDTFPKTGLNGGKGALASATLTSTIEPTAKDWEAIFAYVKRKGAFDLMYRRINGKAWRDRIEAGEKIPGIEEFNRIKLSIRKIGDT